MRAESRAICTSGEPVSFGLRRYCWTIPPFASVDNDICLYPRELTRCVPFCEPRIVLGRPIISSKTGGLGHRSAGLDRRAGLYVHEQPDRADPPFAGALH